MTLQERRQAKGWSQEQLAHMSGLSVRTIQRIEKGLRPSPESRKCLAAVFDITINDLMEDHPMTNIDDNNTAPNTPNSTGTQSPDPAQAPDPVRTENDASNYRDNIRAFKMNMIAYAVLIPALALFNTLMTPGVFWVVWVAFFWAISFALHAGVIKIMFGRFDLNEKLIRPH